VLRLKFPSRSVIVPFVLDSIKTVTPGMGWLALSTTVPCIVFCANVLSEQRRRNETKNGLFRK
jgi:hypothetical protein